MSRYEKMQNCVIGNIFLQILKLWEASREGKPSDGNKFQSEGVMYIYERIN